MNGLITLNNELKMSSRDIAERTGKLHKNVLVDIENMCNGLKVQPVKFLSSYKDAKGETRKCYLLPKHEVMCLVTGYRADLRMKVIKRLDELEAQQNRLALPQTYLEALKALTHEVEQKQIALAERDEAIRTKSWISTKQAQTAMTTASIAVRRANKLADQLGEGKNFLQAKAVPWLSEFFDLKSKENKGVYIALGSFLSKLCALYDIKTIDVPDSAYTTVKAYHIRAINMLRDMLKKDKTILSKYRHNNVISMIEGDRVHVKNPVNRPIGGMQRL